MRVGVPKEVKPDEYRVGDDAGGGGAARAGGHEVFVEAHAGVGSGFADEDYAKVGAKIVAHARRRCSTTRT